MSIGIGELLLILAKFLAEEEESELRFLCVIHLNLNNNESTCHRRSWLYWF